VMFCRSSYGRLPADSGGRSRNLEQFQEDHN
jgi:hypothetical protein